MAAARENQVSLFRVVKAADSLMTKLQQGNGTLGMLATDSTLYSETTKTMHPVPRAADRYPGAPQEVPQDLGILMGKRRAELEVSAGGIVFRRQEGEQPRYLLIRDSYDNWGFPKGHLEDGESPADAAQPGDGGRDGSRAPGCFRARSGSSTGTSGFAAGTSTSIATSSCSRVPTAMPPRRRTRGSRHCQWRTLDEALEVLSYDNARGVLKRAGEMVRTLVAVGAGRSRHAAERQAKG